MKYLIMLVMLMACSFQGYTQKVINLDAIESKKQPVTYDELVAKLTITTHFALVKGDKKPIYRTKSGRWVILKQSKKSGNWYLQYLDAEALGLNDAARK